MRWSTVLKRAALVPPTLLGVGIIVFVLLRVVPGDPIAMMIPPGASSADIARLRALYGLDQPIVTQFITWFGQVLSGDFGRSISLHQRVFELVIARLPATLELCSLAVVMALLLGGIVALLGVTFRGRAAEWLVDSGIGLFLAIPDFLWALILLLVFGVLVPLLPISGRLRSAARNRFLHPFLSARKPCDLSLRYRRRSAAAYAAAGARARAAVRGFGGAAVEGAACRG